MMCASPTSRPSMAFGSRRCMTEQGGESWQKRRKLPRERGVGSSDERAYSVHACNNDRARQR